MKFTVVIPTCDRPALLGECLRRLAPGAQTLAAGEYEVVVTDDGTSEPAGALVRTEFGWARSTQGPHRGPAANRNHGAAGAAGRWLVFIDDDCLPDAGLLAAYARAQEQDAIMEVFEGRTLAEGPKRHPLEHAPINLTGGFLWSCNFMISAALFRDLGGFCEIFPEAAMEDVDLRLRLERRGSAIRFVPGADVVHPWRRIDLPRHTRQQVAAQLLYVHLHPGERRLLSLRQHARNIARYYVREFGPEWRAFGWTALRCQPLRWWEFAYRGWHFLRHRDGRGLRPAGAGSSPGHRRPAAPTPPRR